ncbi:hypothetical protein C2G38_2029845 [Gigaspora rosea]|uniref:Uncharacterized protein n=1 Tax=Gigaspora rosea TaxID=44941 RepID=A0A397VYK0_9GLOM|nr:hypothetical protein C2G38_2029845 [Gigaspora rosea]
MDPQYILTLILRMKILKELNILVTSDVRLSSFLIFNQDKDKNNWIVCNLPFLTPRTNQISKKFLLHYARNISEISYISCSSGYSELGNVCLITELVEISQDQTLFITYQVDFLPSGSIVGLRTLDFQYTNTSYSLQYDIKPLFYGGAVITSWRVENNNIKKRNVNTRALTEVVPVVNPNYQGGSNLPVRAHACESPEPAQPPAAAPAAAPAPAPAAAPPASPALAPAAVTSADIVCCL